MPNKTSMEEIQIIAAKKGGKCLSTTYDSYKIPLEWECKKGHIWFSKLLNIKDNCWCRICAGHPVITIEDCKKIAEERGGKCLSTQYKNGNQELWWECSEKHIWSSSHNNITSKNNWCKYCSNCAQLSIYHLRESTAKFDGYCLSDEYKCIDDKYL